MKLCVVALDYDGTITRDGRVELLVVEGVKEPQGRRIVVILVSGRIMADLRRVLPEHELFDAVVTENGAVLSFPSVPSRLLTHPPSQILLDELCARDVAVGFGDCIIESNAGAAPILNSRNEIKATRRCSGLLNMHARLRWADGMDI